LLKIFENFFKKIFFIKLFDRCGPEDYGQNLCDYNRNFTFGQVVDKVDDNYHTGDLGSGLQVFLLLKWRGDCSSRN